MKKKKQRKLSSYPSNAPRKLIKLYRLAGENGIKLAKQLGINDAHLSKLFNKGLEPKDPIIRAKLFLPKLKAKREKREIKPRLPRPEWMNKWLHLPTEERQRVIKQYLEWKDKNGG